MIYQGKEVLYFAWETLGADRIVNPVAGWQGRNFNDERFRAVSVRWITEHAWPAWVAGLKDELRDPRRGPRGWRDYPRWIRESWDCGNHARDFMAFCSRQMAAMVVRAKARMPDAGEFDGYAGCGVYLMAYDAAGNGRSGPHAANLLLTESGQLRPFEPADGTTFDMTKEEGASIWHLSGD